MTGSSPTSISSPKAFHTLFEPSTILFLHGGWWACTLSHPLMESHSSTTLPKTDLPFLAVILIFFPHLEPPLYQPVNNATIGWELWWNLPSHSEGVPPSPPLLKSLFVRMAWVEEVTGGEHLNWGNDLPLQFKFPNASQPSLEQMDGGNFPLPPLEQMWVPTSGSSLHCPFIQINSPLQSFKVWHGPLHEEIAWERPRRETIKTKRETNKAKFATGRTILSKLSKVRMNVIEWLFASLYNGTNYLFGPSTFRDVAVRPTRGNVSSNSMCLVLSCLVILSLLLLLYLWFKPSLES